MIKSISGMGIILYTFIWLLPVSAEASHLLSVAKVTVSSYITQEAAEDGSCVPDGDLNTAWQSQAA